MHALIAGCESEHTQVCLWPLLAFHLKANSMTSTSAMKLVIGAQQMPNTEVQEKMEEPQQQQQQGKKRRRRKKKNNNGGGRRRNRDNYYSFDSPSSSSDDDDDDNTNMRTMFPEMLSSLLNLHTQFAQSLLKKSLQKLLQSLNHQTLIIENSLLSLLPHLLLTTIHYPSLTRRTAEIIGAISLLSFEANERIASDDEILKALMVSLSNRCKSVAMAACNAVLDISTTSIGRKRLCEVSAVEKLISVFLQAATSPAKYDFLHTIGNGVNNFPVLALDTTMALINNCDMDQLVLISKKSCEIFLRYLKELWAIVQGQILPTNFAECSRGFSSSLTNVRIHDLAETIFRLSINLSHCSISCTSEVVKRNIFGPNLSDLENFMLNCWEMSPCLFRRLSVPVNEHDDIFSSFVQSFNSKRTLDVLLPSMLRGLVSCPPFPSDDLDIINFLKEVKDGLGLPLVYEQDIRVLKTVDVIPKTNQEDLKKEVHFLNEHTSFSKMNDPDILTIGDVRKCKEAFQEGYTIALRGMEFRLESIAAIADGLAVLFGQPSIGANAYLTPPKSQGLARHYDDHCVFVCQLLGQKQWKVFTRPTLLLPRLYEPLGNLVGSGGGGAAPECKQFLLDEGDILYIPRGCPHEACTPAEMDDASTRFSLHLTLGIEVEPPFEWEGFAHVALHCWNQKQKPHTPIGSLLGKLNLLAIYLLHVSIQLIGRRDPVFQKACMVASFSLPSDNEENQRSDVLDLNQRNTFSYVINCINKEARFLEAFGIVEQSIQENKEDLFQRMGWLRHLQEADNEEGLDWTNPLMEFEDLYRLYNRNRDDAEAAFMQVKSKFCEEVIFKDVCESFKILLQKYRKVRKQYMNGMLSLHCI